MPQMMPIAWTQMFISTSLLLIFSLTIMNNPHKLYQSVKPSTKNQSYKTWSW